MSEMPISEAREHISEMVGRARYGHEPTILTHYGRPAAVVISFEEYQRLKHAAEEADDYELPPRSKRRSKRRASIPSDERLTVGVPSLVSAHERSGRA